MWSAEYSRTYFTHFFSKWHWDVSHVDWLMCRWVGVRLIGRMDSKYRLRLNLQLDQKCNNSPSPLQNPTWPSSRTKAQQTAHWVPHYNFKAPLTISSYAFRKQEWSNLAKDDVFLRLRKTPPLVSFSVGWMSARPSPTHEHSHHRNEQEIKWKSKDTRRSVAAA
jgi:hypothetical protein